MKSSRKSTLALLSPWLISFALFGAYPILFSLAVSFTNYNPLQAGFHWLGFQNYGRAMGDPLFWQSLKVTFLFVAGTIPLTTTGALFLAVLLNRSHRARGFLRASFFLPTVYLLVVLLHYYDSFYMLS